MANDLKSPEQLRKEGEDARRLEKQREKDAERETKELEREGREDSNHG